MSVRKAKQKKRTRALERSKMSYRLHISLRDVQPPVWRSFTVWGDTRLDELHTFIQWSMGWNNEHLHQFRFKGCNYGQPSNGIVFGFGLSVLDEKKWILADLDLKPGDVLEYWYDFGDDWYHDIRIESISPDGPELWEEEKRSGACPPEDCGGPFMYSAMVEALNDPRHQLHERAVEWLGEDFDPNQD